MGIRICELKPYGFYVVSNFRYLGHNGEWWYRMGDKFGHFFESYDAAARACGWSVDGFDPIYLGC
jgi:hypothetical protein